jgi:hypothetical protein
MVGKGLKNWFQRRKKSPGLVKGVLKNWCSRCNDSSGIRKWYGVALVLLLAGVGLFSFQHPLYGIGLIAASYVTARLAPKGEALSSFETTRRYDYVPDELLHMLAEAPTLPTELKAEIASPLLEQGRLTYDDLFGLENLYLNKQDKRQCEKGAGYRKMVSFIGLTPDHE